MQSLLELTKNYQIERPKTDPRREIIKDFTDEINKERIGTGNKMITWIAVNMKLMHIKEFNDLEVFYKKCLEYKSHKGSFSKCFWGALKVRK